METELCNWIAQITKQEVKPEKAHEQLMSGVVLCTLLNTIAPNTCKFNKMAKMPFIHRENILAFIQGIRKYGVPDMNNFDTNDLYEQKNMKQFWQSIESLARVCAKKNPEISMPSGVVKEVDARVVDHTNHKKYSAIGGAELATLQKGKELQEFEGPKIANEVIKNVDLLKQAKKGGQ